jgi:nucleoside-diphosphate-sugar epimerase
MVFVTGGTGYVGKYVLEKLYFGEGFGEGKANGDKLKVIVRKESDVFELKKKYPKMEFFIGDLSDRDKLTGFLKGERVVLHLAAALHGSYNEMHKPNIEGFSNLIFACNKNKVEKIVFLSSMSVKRPFLDDYAKTKIEGEKMLFESGIKNVVIRPTIIFGGLHGSFSEIVGRLTSIPFIIPVFGDGKYKLAPVHVEDVARAVAIAADKKAKQEGMYEIGGELISFNEFARILRKRYKMKRIILHLPMFFVKVAARVLEFIKLPVITTGFVKNITASTNVNTTRFIKDFKFKPRGFEERF